MTKSFKIVTLVLTGVLIVIFTMLGVAAAKKVSALPLGQKVSMSALDSGSGPVGLVNLLLIGIDDDGTRSDTIMLISYDGYSNRINILSMPRDTRIMMNGYHQKLNASIGVGIQNVEKGIDKEKEEELIRQVKKLTGIPIHYFMTLDFNALKDIIDALGGVDFNIPYNMDYDDPAQDLHIHLKAGYQHLDGQAAHDFVRFRHNNSGSAPGEYAMGDEGRIYWQQEFMKELFKQKAKPQYFSKITDLFDVISKNMRTNYTMQDLLKHLDAMEKIDTNSIGAYKLPGESWYEDYGNGNGIWWYMNDTEKLQKLIDDVFLPRSKEEWEKQKVIKEAENANNRGTGAHSPAGTEVSGNVIIDSED